MAKRKLPPDPENMNDGRAKWAGAALRHFQCTTGTDWDEGPADLLGDLMHWCDRNGFDFETELSRARRHYQTETAAWRRWLLVDYDGTGLMQIQANDQHVSGDQFSDEEAIDEARKEAAAGDAKALAAIAAHDRDQVEIAQLGPVAS
jgi:hypothetical protein